MRIVEPSVKLIDYTPNPVSLIASVARTCYQSKAATADDNLELVQRLIRHGHHAMLEFTHLTFRIVTDRGISHELVRHRIASYAQESTRYCNYGNKDIEFICPNKITHSGAEFRIWQNHMMQCEQTYKRMLDLGCAPQTARSVLPNSLKTEIVASFNVRSFRNFLKLRTASDAHPDMQHIANLCRSLAENTDAQYKTLWEDLYE